MAPSWRKFGKDRRGVAAVEFALIAPVMVLLYCGLVELTQGMIAERKANHVASTIGDLTTQADTVSTADLADIFLVGNTIMSPFPTTSLQMRLTSITADANGAPKVTWSRAYGGMSALGVGGTVSVPLTLAAGDSIVMAETKYQYDSVLNYVLPSPVNYSEVYYMRPRRSDNVTCPTC